MKVSELKRLLNAEEATSGEDKELIGGYCGDFLSFVMNKAPASCAWFTIMSNVNVAAVSSLADVGAVVVCEGVTPDPALKEKMKLTGQTLLLTEMTIFEAVKTAVYGGLN